MFSDRIEFDSPGGFYGGVNEKNILEKQYSRNEVLTKVFNKIQYTEELGEGWDKIIDEHKKHPLKPKLPIVKDVEGTVIVTLFSTRKKFEKIEKKTEIRVTELNERQKKALDLINTKGKVTMAKLREIYPDVNRRTLTRDINTLIKIGLLERRGRGRRDIHYTRP